MGGGDLNLKKSWHPSTMKNMEKVWKAEQKHEQEKKKIAELQRELREERQREEIRKFAEDGGVIEKKDECKLDWMYKGPGGHVSRDDYLLGRPIDKSFDLLQEAEKQTAQSSSADGQNKVLPGRSGILDDQVDMARKLQEDPLLLIKKKEMESRSQILNNPVKLKKLQRLLKAEKEARLSKKNKKKSKKKKKRRSSSDSSSSSEEEDGDLDRILASKYNRLREKLKDVEVSKLLSDDEEKGKEKKKSKEKDLGRHEEKRFREDKNGANDSKMSSRRYGLQHPHGYEKKPQVETHTIKKENPDKRITPPAKRPSEPPKKSAPKRPLTSEELEKRRREMMDNARWRDEQRERNVRSHREQEKRDKKAAESHSYDPSFLRKQLSIAASVGSVEGRIKSNINNIQRSGGAMDKNFAKR